MPRFWIHISPPFTSILGKTFFFFREPFILFTFLAFLCSCSVIHHVQLSVIPWNTACQSSPSFTISWRLLRLMSIESMLPSNHLILCHPLSRNQRVFHEMALHIRCPKYWSFGFSISFFNVYSELNSFRIDWLDLLSVQGTLKSLLQYHNSKTSIPQCSTFFTV